MSASSMRYEVEHKVYFSGNLSGRKRGQVQLWVPTPKGVVPKFSITPDSSKFLQNVGCTINYWKLPMGNFSITCLYQHSGEPRIPPATDSFIKHSLAQCDPLTEVTSVIKNMELLDQLKQKRPIDQVKTIKRFLINNLEYKYPPTTRKAEEVLKIKKSDCGGYHATFVAMARSLGIPAVLDFGFRAGGVNRYHVWAWWFDTDRKSWLLEDLNDEQKKRALTDRISMTLSTNLRLSPTYPRKVLYLQSHLVWIENLISLQKLGFNFRHDSEIKIKRLT